MVINGMDDVDNIKVGKGNIGLREIEVELNV